jgi:outer membrane protein
MCRCWASTLVTLLVVSLTSLQIHADGVLTLEDALTLAFDNNPSVQNAGISVDKVGDELEAARTKLYPALGLGARAGRNLSDEAFTFEQGVLGTVAGEPVPPRDVEIGTQRDYGAAFSLEVKQPLVGLYRIGLDIDKLEVQDKLARQELRAKRQEIARRVKQQYYEILETQSALEATDESIAFYESLVELVTQKVEQKTALEYELLDAEAKLAKAEHDGFKQRNTLLSERERLNGLIGRDVATPFTATTKLAERPDDTPITDAEARALAQRPEVHEARLELEQAQTELDIKRSTYLPEVDLTATYSRLHNTEFIPDESFFVGLVAKWEFFDWGRRSDEVSKAELSINEARNKIREAHYQVVTEVNSRIRDLENARNLVGVTRKAREAGRQKVRVVRNRYEQNAALLDDLLRAQSDLEDSINDYHQAVLQVWTAQANLARALGEE